MDIGQKASWDFHFFNYGKSPAVALLERMLVVFGKDVDHKIDDTFFTTKVHREDQKDVGNTLAPGEGLYTTALSKDVLTDADLKFINETDGGIAIIGYFEYFDLDENEYHSEIGRFRHVNGKIGECVRHNRIH